MNARTEVRPIDDLRSYIAALEANGQLHRIKSEVDWKFELSHVANVNEEQRGPALMFENVKDYDIPVFTSAFTTPQRMAISLEQDASLSMSQLSKKWMELTTKKMIEDHSRYAGTLTYIDEIISSGEEAKAFKPSPKVFHLGIERAGCAKENILWVTGHFWEAYSADGVGLKTAWTNRARHPALPIGYTPTYVTRTLQELADILAKLRTGGS